MTPQDAASESIAPHPSRPHHPQRIALFTLAGVGIFAAGLLTGIGVDRLIRPSPYWGMLQANSAPFPVSLGNPAASGPQGMMASMRVRSEVDYLRRMIPHHEEAIATARLLLEKSDRPEMHQFAQQIIDTQSAEIAQMQNWLQEWYPDQQQPVSDYVPMMRDLSQLEGDALDQAFLEDMIMHHMEAVMMSQMLLHHNRVEHAPVRPFAQQIATTQHSEIWQMQAWLQDWFDTSGRMGSRYGNPGHRPHGPGMGWRYW